MRVETAGAPCARPLDPGLSEPASPAPLAMPERASPLSLYGVGPFGLKPLVLCMIVTSSGSAGTRGAVGPRTQDCSHASARRRGECFRTGRKRPVEPRTAKVPLRQTNLGYRRMAFARHSEIRSTATLRNVTRFSAVSSRAGTVNVERVRASLGTFGAHWTEWDTRAFARGSAIAALTLVLVAVVTAASDEGGLGWGVRAGRTLPLAPVCAAVGAWLALAPARARGDDRALETLGRSPWQREAAAIAGGAIVAVVSALAIACLARIDVAGFYPRAEESIRWTYDGSGFTSGDGKWRVAGGAPAIVPAPEVEQAPTGIPARGRSSAALATAALGLALPMLVARARSRRAAALTSGAIGAMALATVLAFQAAAAAVASPLVAPLPPLLLLAWAASRYRAGPWSRATYPR
jgi:hypothetical protein